MYGTDNVAHCFSNSLSLNDWMKDDEFFNLMDMDWEQFLEQQPKKYGLEFNFKVLKDLKVNIHLFAKHDN